MGIVSGEEESVRGDSVRAAEFVGGIVSGEGTEFVSGDSVEGYRIRCDTAPNKDWPIMAGSALGKA